MLVSLENRPHKNFQKNKKIQEAALTSLKAIKKFDYSVFLLVGKKLIVRKKITKFKWLYQKWKSSKIFYEIKRRALGLGNILENAVVVVDGDSVGDSDRSIGVGFRR